MAFRSYGGKTLGVCEFPPSLTILIGLKYFNYSSVKYNLIIDSKKNLNSSLTISYYGGNPNSKKRTYLWRTG